MNKDLYKIIEVIEIPQENINIFERAEGEYRIASENITFMLNRHMNDTDISFLNSEIYRRLLMEQLEKKIVYEKIQKEITDIYVSNKYKDSEELYWEIAFSSNLLYIYTPKNSQLQELENVPSIRPKFEQYSDSISRLYPELHQEKDENGKLPLSKSFTFQVTDACNLACTYCYQINKGIRVMNFEDAKNAIDLLLSGNKKFNTYLNPKFSPGIVIEFIGGEPFLQVDLMDQIVDYFRLKSIEMNHPWSKLFRISVCSNGVLYFDEKVQKFLEKNKNLISFSITIDGNKELHDSCRVFPDGRPSYDIAVAAAQDWMNKGYFMGSKITIAPGNIDYFYDAIMHMIDLGYEEINANCVYEEGWNKELATKLYYQMKKISDEFDNKGLKDKIYCSLFSEIIGKPKAEDDLQNWCGGTGVMLSMDPNGYLYPCIRYMESSLGEEQPPLRIGHVNTGIGCSCEESNCIECLKKIDRRTQSTDECFYCPIAEGCSWCSAYNYQVTGTPNSRATYICDMHKARVLANSYYWNKYYLSKGQDKRFEIHCPKEWALEIIDEDEYNMLLNLSSERR